MSQLLGPILLVGLMVWVLRFMLGVRTGRRTGPKRYERPPTEWSKALVWIPTGYGLAKLLGTGAPLSIVVITCALTAAIQRIFPRPFEIIIGGGSTVVAVLEAVDGTGCRLPIGAQGLLLLGVFAGTAATAVILGGRPILKTSQYLAAGAAMTELVLFSISPAGVTLTDHYGAGMLVLPGLVLALSIAIGAYPNLGLATVGACLIAAEVVLAITPGACDHSATVALLGAGVFAASRMFLSKRSRRSLVGVR